MNTLSYMLEIYEPGSDDDCLCGFSSTTPFPKISEGEHLNMYDFSIKLRVSKIIHLVWQNDNLVSFKTMIYTVDDK